MNPLKENGRNSQRPFGNTLYVRYMVSRRCKKIAKTALDKLKIKYLFSVQGAIEFPEGISREQQATLKKSLHTSGLELLDTSESILIDKIIHSVTEVIHNADRLPKLSFKEIIHENLGGDCEPTLQIFSDVKGVSVTQFIILQKIERAKELLLYHDFTLPEIAEKLYYKNEDYFVSQFKKITGLPPSYFTDLKDKREKTIANL
ncbi:MAG: helix-turn-helix domain-containing protein [Balneolaceae bacterium]